MALHLPNEIILIIFSFLEPGDVVNTAVTCSYFHQLAGGRLKEHRELCAKYKHLSVENSVQCDFLEKAYQDPWLWYYVKELKYEPYRPRIGDMTSTFEEMIVSLLASSPYADYAVHDYGLRMANHAKMNKGLEWRGFFLGVLLTLLPNLTHLHIETSDFYHTLCAPMVRTIIEDNKRNPSLKSLRKLSSITLIPWDRQHVANMGWVIPLLELPSLHLFEGFTITCDLCLRLFGTIPSSSLEEIDVTFSDIHHPQFLSRLTNLRKFTYHYSTRYLDKGTTPTDLHQMIARLKRPCSQTLEILEFRNGRSIDRMSSSLRDFRGFRKLRRLMIPAPFVFGEGPGVDAFDDDLPPTNKFPRRFTKPKFGWDDMARCVPRLVDILPQSIESVEISIVECPEAASHFLKDLAELKHERLPSLKTIVFRGREADRDGLEPLKDMKVWGSVGVKVEVCEVLPVKTFIGSEEEADLEDLDDPDLEYVEMVSSDDDDQ
ncbi:hypothetical protein FQN54_006034 [Arachnomyces sp. PD_36]|nr:hypothetical protein FQN54_006034 [Arachnomyces sp. PD_36]